MDERGISFLPIPVNQWKGQLPKKIVIKRIQKIIPRRNLETLQPKDDCWDAIGLGLHVRGVFK